MDRQYCITTPIGPDHVDIIQNYKRSVRRLDPRPNRVGVVTRKEIFTDHFAGDDMFEFVSSPPENRPNMHVYEIIAHNRENLRKWFLYKRDEDYVMWLDTDIEIIYSNTAKLLMEIAENDGSYGVINPVQSSVGQRPSFGLACCLMHRDILQLSRFYSSYFMSQNNQDGKVAHRIGETVIFLKIIEAMYNQINSKAKYDDLFHYLNYGEIPAVHHTSSSETKRHFIDKRKNAGKSLGKSYDEIRIKSTV